MDFEQNENQTAILGGLEQLIAGLQVEAPKEGVLVAFSTRLDAELEASGFLDIAREAEFTLLDSALVVERLARLPVSAEVAFSALVGPLFPTDTVQRPFALVTANPLSPARFLTVARTLLVDKGDELLVIDVDPSQVEEVESLFAYPYGKLASLEGMAVRRMGADLATGVRRRWRLALAVEGSGLMQSAIDTVIEHVTNRYQFNRPLGSFQAIQHRLATAAGTQQSARWLALRAAWSDSEADCALAASYLQDSIPTIVYDLHQFCGAMGLTLEFPLHFWTYRLKAMLGDLGGSSAQARAAAIATWQDAA